MPLAEPGTILIPLPPHTPFTWTWSLILQHCSLGTYKNWQEFLKNKGVGGGGGAGGEQAMQKIPCLLCSSGLVSSPCHLTSELSKTDTTQIELKQTAT